MRAGLRAMVLSAAALVVAARAATSPEPVLGVLEERQDCSSEPDRTVAVQPAFVRYGGEWRSLWEMPWPARELWTITLDGRTLGTVRTTPASDGQGRQH